VTVNPDGTIPQRAIHGFVWDHGHYRRLDPPRSVLTLPYGINNHGQVVGSYFDAAGRQHGFLLARGRYRTFDAPGRVDTVALDINDGGKVIVPEPGVELNGFRLATD